MKHLRIVLCVSLLALLAACGPSNNVRLLPPPPLDASVLPAPNAPRVTVVAFEDKRMDQTVIGTRRDNSGSSRPHRLISRVAAPIRPKTAPEAPIIGMRESAFHRA